MEEQIVKELKDLNGVVSEINTSVAVQNQRMEDFLSQYSKDQKQNKEEHASIKTKLTEHNGRLKKLEKWKYGFMGSLTAVLFLLGWLWNFIEGYIK